MILNAKQKLINEFRQSRGQETRPHKDEKKPPMSRGKREQTPYDSFLRKYHDLENTIDTLGTRDLVYYFREVAEENGQKYIISNIKKDMAIMKRLRDNFTNREICAMIEFLYESEQDYLEKDHLSLNLLGSQWVNTIYADMKLWVEDKYKPKKNTIKPNRVSKKEWHSEKSDDVNIGVKL